MVLAIHFHAALLCVIVFIACFVDLQIRIIGFYNGRVYLFNRRYLYIPKQPLGCYLRHVYVFVDIGNPPKKYRAFAEGDREQGKPFQAEIGFNHSNRKQLGY
jgi:hypothetical protein